MTVKKEYNIGDTVWVYGITQSNKITKGSIVHKLEIPGYVDTQYIIAIPTHIEDLLEIRTWHNISQDAQGPIGAFRALGEELASTKKFVRRTGFTSSDEIEELDEPTAEEIHAAIEKSRQATTHSPLVLKENKPKRRNFSRKKKV